MQWASPTLIQRVRLRSRYAMKAIRDVVVRKMERRERWRDRRVKELVAVGQDGR